MQEKKTIKRIVSMLLKTVVVICAFVGIRMTTTSSSETFMGGSSTYLFFTIQSNIWICIVCLIGLVRMLLGKAPTRLGMLLKFVFTVSITLTGCVFGIMLAPMMGPKAWALSSSLCHAVVPVCAVADFLVVGGEVEYKKWEEWYAALPPLYYVFFAAVGYVNNWNFGGGHNYPYFFLNWGSKAGAFGFSSEMPFLGVMWWIIILLLFIVCCGKLYIILVSKKHKRTKTEAKADIIFRPVEDSDAERATEIEAICFPPSEACTLPIMKERVRLAGDSFIVAIDRKCNKMIGFINALCTNELTLKDELYTDTSLHNPNGENVMICSVAVLPEYRGQGIARSMMAEFLKTQKAQGKKRAILTCVPGKVSMYSKFGFEDNGMSESVWGGEVWHEMSCEL